jgi:hypothetical protein
MQNALEKEVTMRAQAKAMLRAIETLPLVPDVGWSHCGG